MAKGFFSRFTRTEAPGTLGSPPAADPTPMPAEAAELAEIVREIARRGLPPAPRKVALSLRLDAEVLDWFKAQGPGYQTRINAILKAYKERAG